MSSFPLSHPGWPRLSADLLREVADPLPALSPPLRWSGLAAARAAIATAQRPRRAAATPPEFLLPHQVDTWRRVIAALDDMGGAILAESVGAGKTWIALAAAATERAAGREAVAIVPAVLREQWRSAARSAGVRLGLFGHERVSRGHLPSGNPRLVIIDEAHRFRHPSTRRVRTIAPWLVGRRVLLLTATPIVNRIGDLVALLRLALPDDALALDGIERLGVIEQVPEPPDALRRVVIRTPREACRSVPRHVAAIAPDAAEERRAVEAVRWIDSLALSTAPATRRLVRTVLLDAAQSSDAAFRAALQRYRRLLLQSRDAGGGTSRAVLRRFAGEQYDQLVLWDVVAPEQADGDLAMSDLSAVESLLRSPAAGDAWVDGVRARLCDNRPTVCFARHRATAAMLRTALGDECGWVTGSRAGIGPHRMPRQLVLEAFGPGRSAWRARRRPPRVLVATDVAAEGLDLQAAGRIAHIDLPWTAVRVEQREGRLLRIGQLHGEVEVIVRPPAPAIEAALRSMRRIERKRSLATRWLDAMTVTDAASDPDGMPQVVAAAVTTTARVGILVAMSVQRGCRAGVQFVMRAADGEWITDQARLAGLLDAASAPRSAMTEPALRRELAAAARHVVQRLHLVPPLSPILARRVLAAARGAARRHDAEALSRLDRLLRFATGAPGPALGAELLAARLAALSDHELGEAIVPEPASAGVVAVRPIAVVCCGTFSRH